MSNYRITIADLAPVMVTEADAPAQVAADLKADAEHYGVWHIPAERFSAEAEGILMAARAMAPAAIHCGSESDISVRFYA